MEFGRDPDRLAFQAAVAAGYRVSDGLLAQQIRSFEGFQRFNRLSTV